MLSIGCILGILMVFRHAEVAYPLVLSWAFAGIVVRQSEYQLVFIGASIAAILMLVSAVLGIFKRWKYRQPQFEV
jgi:translocator protein